MAATKISGRLVSLVARDYEAGETDKGTKFDAGTSYRLWLWTAFDEAPESFKVAKECVAQVCDAVEQLEQWQLVECEGVMQFGQVQVKAVAAVDDDGLRASA